MNACMRRWVPSISLCILIFTLFSHGISAQAQPAPPEGERVGELIEITIIATQGTVQVREAENAKWQRAKPGMKISVGWEIRTGLRSAIQFKIGEDHTVTVDRLGSIKVLDAIRTDEKVITDVGMKYGRTKYVVDAVAEEHDATVRAPSATLAVRGSEVTISDNDAFGYAAMVGHSRDVNIQARGLNNLPPVLMQKGSIEGKQPPAIAQFDSGDNKPIGAARTALASTRLGANPNQMGGTRGGIAPIETSLTREEFHAILVRNGETTASGDGERRQRQKHKQQFQQEQNNANNINFHGLDVLVMWTGMANVDLAVRDPSNTLIATSQGAFGNSVQVARPGGPAEGFASPDDFGTGGTGFESVTFSAEHLVGSYTAFLRFDQNNSTQPANVQLKVVQQDPNAPMGMKVLRDVSGTLSPGNLNISIPFNAPVITSGGTGGGGGTGQ